jgi:hypothetical protein
MLPNQIFHLKGFLMDSFTLGPTPKIDFTRTLEHTLAKTWELADLRFSLNTFSKPYGIHNWILYKNTDLEAPIYRLQETSKIAEIRTLSVERLDGNLPRPDGFLWYTSETAP